MSSSSKKGYIKPPVNPHQEPYADELNSLLESLHEHDDRSLVLTMAAFTEDTLELLLLNYLREPKQAKELVNGFNAPLGTFSARIKAAYVLGLIHRDGFKTIEILRKIRNKFAHNWDGVSLDREDIVSLINQLTISHREEFGLVGPGDREKNDRERLIEKIADILIGLRMLAKQLNKDGRKAPLMAGKFKPVEVDLVVVDHFSDEAEQ